MENEKKKKIYYVIIGVCALGSIGIFALSNRPVAEVDPPVTNTIPQTTTSSSSSGLSGASPNRPYTVPGVFPNDNKFDTSVLQSTVFRTLKKPGEFKLTEEELGRDNPFGKF